MDHKPVVFEQEFFPEDDVRMTKIFRIPWKNPTKKKIPTWWKDQESKKCLAIPIWNLRRDLHFFQSFLKETGILEELEAAGIQEGDTVRMYGLSFHIL